MTNTTPSASLPSASPSVIVSNSVRITTRFGDKTITKPVYGVIHILKGDCPDFGFANKEWDDYLDYDKEKRIAYFYTEHSFNMGVDFLTFASHIKQRERNGDFKVDKDTIKSRTYIKPNCWIVDKEECSFGYCCERLYNRGCLPNWENMWYCDECKDTMVNQPRDMLSLRILNKTKKHSVKYGDDVYTNIFGGDELIKMKELKPFMSVPIMPLRCLCGCSHILDFTTEAQNKNFTSKRTTGKYRLFFSPDHIKTFKRNNQLS
jgi:hypothetical protein